MKSKLIFGTMLGLLLIASVSFAEDDADKKRLLKEYEKMQKEKEKAAKEAEEEARKEAERLAKEQEEQQQAQVVEETTEVVTENGEVAQVTEEQQVVVEAPKKPEKDMTAAERMDMEVQRIKKRMLEINDKIDNYNKTNEMIDNLEKNVGELERKVNY